MFTIFNSESLWIGTDLVRFNQIRDRLDNKRIAYKHKTKNHMAQWNGIGTTRGMTGNIGISSDHMYQYEILVHKKDYEAARHAIG
ncbi:MAG: hypothetical protein Q4C82_08135 [Eubacteriales bacterium]|nr:hypothetical protein [Eubacteriales bacterium]